MIDRHYTPTEWALRMVLVAKVERPLVVADWSCGEGALLRAADEFWGLPSVTYVGLDSDEATIRGIGPRDGFTLGCLDVLDSVARSQSAVWAAGREADLILLNPPFSYRGAGKRRVESKVGGLKLEYGGSPAGCFLALAVMEGEPGSVVVAVVPRNFLFADKDGQLLRYLQRECHFEVVEDMPRGVFAGVSADAVLVRFRVAPRTTLPSGWGRDLTQEEPLRGISVVRGRIPVHRLEGLQTSREGVPFCHTTDLQSGQVVPRSARVPESFSLPFDAVLLPRVGLPTADKVVVAKAGSVALSDCVMAVSRAGMPVNVLAAFIIERIESLRTAYLGSCARYITVGALAQFIARLGPDARTLGREPRVAGALVSEASSVGAGSERA